MNDRKLNKKLNKGEVERTVGKILKKYEQYVIRFLKSPKLKYAFEQRYRKAVISGINIQNFLAAEISAIEELIKKETDNLKQSHITVHPDKKKESFADKVLQEFKEKIAKYTDIAFHKDAGNEARRLLGALNELYHKYAPHIQDVFKNSTHSLSTQDVMEIESRIRIMGGIDEDKISPRLSRHYALLNQFPRDYKAIEREEKSFILDSAFLLHDLLNVLSGIELVENSDGSKDSKNLDNITTFINNVIDDFRLKDLKRRNF